MINPRYFGGWQCFFLFWFTIFICIYVTEQHQEEEGDEICEDVSCGIIEGCFKKHKEKK